MYGEWTIARIIAALTEKDKGNSKLLVLPTPGPYFPRSGSSYIQLIEIPRISQMLSLICK